MRSEPAVRSPRVRHLTAMIAVAAVALAACGDGSTGSPPDATGDTGPSTTIASPTSTDADTDDGAGEVTGPLDGAWVATAGTVDGTPVTLIDTHDITLNVTTAADPATAEVGGTAACNHYGGTAEVGDGTIAFGAMMSTEMACEPFEAMELEQLYLRSLLDVTSYAVAGDTLTLTGPDVEWRFDRLPPVPTAELVGTTWSLDTYLTGDTASHLAGMEDATLTLRADGTLTGSTGCRELAGEWVERGAEIVLTDFRAEGDCPAERESLDTAVVTVLGDGFTVEIDGNRLTVWSSGGEGLSYVAG